VLEELHNRLDTLTFATYLIEHLGWAGEVELSEERLSGLVKAYERSHTYIRI
jgi:hypothetical protein